jgi:hypothetical protein
MPPLRDSLHLREAAIHEQFGSRDLAAVIGCEKHHGLGNLRDGFPPWALGVKRVYALT